ncbi:MAG: aspartyl/asparaginyl beta-hydroxylase domain-containing protein [Pseudomonadota bacterium]
MASTPAQLANAEGMAALRAGDAAAAVAAFLRATAADPEAGPLWRNLAHAHRMAGDAGGERTALNRALALDRLDFAAQLRLAQLHQRLGEETQALIAWNAVEQLAAQLPALSPEVAAELAAGQSYCDGLRAKLAVAAEAALTLDQGRDETEERRVRAFVDQALGRRRVYHNQCAGVFYPFLPEDEYFDRRHFPWLDELEAATPAIQAELRGLLDAPGDLIRPYVRFEEGTPDNEWSPLDGSLDWSACFLWEYGEPHRAVIERCPQTAAVLERLPLARIPGRAPNAFFSVLRPQSKIPPHTGVTNTRAIIHLALEVPPGCGFRVGNETREWVEGKAFAFDDSIEHEAWNNSDQRRAVLIVDSWNPHLSAREQAAILQYFAAADGALVGGGPR